MNVPEALHPLLIEAARNGASDLHLSAAHPPCLRMDGEIVPLVGQVLSSEDAHHCLSPLWGGSDEQDGSFSLDDAFRVRYNIYDTLHGPAAAFRFIPLEVPKLETLNLPSQLERITQLHKGLVLVCGATGSGKSTTLAALLDRINHTQKKHIITIEDPVEYLHPSAQSIVHQRELGRNTQSYAEALRAAMRQDPDIILVGEMRDPETIQTALTAAETGHLVFSTMHTFSAAKAMDRIVDAFPAHSQSMIVSMLSTSIEAVISQNLIRRQGQGRVAATEIMLATPAIRNLIREGKQFQIPSIIETGQSQGMRTMQQSIEALIISQTISQNEAKRCLRLHELSESDVPSSPAHPGAKASSSQQF